MAHLMPLPLTVSCFVSISQVIGCEDRLRNDLYCVELGVKLYSNANTVSCFSKIQIGFTFLVPADPGSPGKRAVKRVCVCVCVIVMMILFILILLSFCEPIKVICIILAVVIVFSIIMCLKLSHAQTRQNGAISFFTALRLLTLATERPSVLQ